MKGNKEKLRDDRDYDTTSLHAKFHGTNLHRDYTAHFFRWNFARNFINKTHDVLEIGCGVEKPLPNILFKNMLQQVNSYVGVDLNPLKPTGFGKRAVFLGEFNFVKDWKKLNPAYAVETKKSSGYDVIIHLEVIEHMKVIHGRKMLKACLELLRPGGVMLMSTPCYDGRRHAANHIHEYTVPELQQMTEKVGFVVEQRFGTFMDTRHLKPRGEGWKYLHDQDPELGDAVTEVYKYLSQYYDRDALSCFFAPLFPDHARNNLWVCRKPGGGK